MSVLRFLASAPLAALGMEREQALPEGVPRFAGDAPGEFIDGRDAGLCFGGQFMAREARSDEL